MNKTIPLVLFLLLPACLGAVSDKSKAALEEIRAKNSINSTTTLLAEEIPQTLSSRNGSIPYHPEQNFDRDCKFWSWSDDKSEKYGYKDMDSPDQWVIAPRFDDATSFESGLGIVKVGNKCGVINSNGNFVIELSCDEISIAKNDFIRVRINGKWGAVNLETKSVISPQFDELGDHNQNRIPFRIGKKYGYIDLNGKRVIDAIYQFAEPFSIGSAWVKFKGKMKLIDLNGNDVVVSNVKNLDQYYRQSSKERMKDPDFGRATNRVIHIGPRGGIYHYSENRNKIYHKR